MIALQSRGAKMPDPAAQTAKFVNMMNMAKQQEAAQRQASLAQQSMDINQAQEARAVELHNPALAKAGYEADTAQIKMMSDFSKLSVEGLKQAQNVEDAVKIGDYIKSKFKDPQLQALVDQTVQKLTANPANFEAARQQVLFQSMETDKQLDQTIANLTTGAETYQVASPKYAGAPGGMKATEIPGTRVQAPQGITYVKGEDGSIYPMPSKTSDGFATPAPSAGAPGQGSPVANALKTNPGALKDGPFAQSQPGYTGKSGGFATFDTPAAGIAAQENLLRRSYINKGVNTINKIVNKYAPQGPENSAASVSGYKEYIRQRTGVDINAPISDAQIPAIAKAMREFETDKKVGGRGTAGAPTPVIVGTGKAKTTEDERKIGSNVTNMISAAKEIANIVRTDASAIAPSGVEYTAGQVPFYGDEAARFAQSGPRQRFNAALEKILSAVTFINTGAGVSKEQMDGYRRSYFPTYQDTDRTRQSKLLGVVQFIRDAKVRAGNAWTPELDASLNSLQNIFASPKTYGSKAKPATPTKSSDGWGSAKQVGN